MKIKLDWDKDHAVEMVVVERDNGLVESFPMDDLIDGYLGTKLWDWYSFDEKTSLLEVGIDTDDSEDSEEGYETLEYDIQLKDLVNQHLRKLSLDEV